MAPEAVTVQSIPAQAASICLPASAPEAPSGRVM